MYVCLVYEQQKKNIVLHDVAIKSVGELTTKYLKVQPIENARKILPPSQNIKPLLLLFWFKSFNHFNAIGSLVNINVQLNVEYNIITSTNACYVINFLIGCPWKDY